MDDWSNSPAGNAVSEPAPNHQSPMNPPHTPTTARLTRSRQAPPTGDGQPLPATQALDPTGLARQQGNEVRGEAPKPLYPPDNPTITPTSRQTNVKNGQPPLDITRPFMDDKRLSISGRRTRYLAPPEGRSRLSLVRNRPSASQGARGITSPCPMPEAMIATTMVTPSRVALATQLDVAVVGVPHRFDRSGGDLEPGRPGKSEAAKRTQLPMVKDELHQAGDEASDPDEDRKPRS